jgi:hypothetical protein
VNGLTALFTASTDVVTRDQHDRGIRDNSDRACALDAPDYLSSDVADEQPETTER